MYVKVKVAPTDQCASSSGGGGDGDDGTWAHEIASHGTSSSSEARRTPPTVRPPGARRPARHLEARISLKLLGLER